MQNNGRPAQHQAHGKPNRAQQITEKQTRPTDYREANPPNRLQSQQITEKQIHGFKEKKKPKTSI